MLRNRTHKDIAGAGDLTRMNGQQSVQSPTQISECGDSSPLWLAATRRGAIRTADESVVEKVGASSRTPKLSIECGELSLDRSSLTRQWLTLALLCCLSGPLRAQTPATTTADAYVQQFEASYHDVRSLQAEFSQTYTVGGRPPRIEAGRVAFARGGLMRWDYQRPTEKLFVSDGKEVSLYVPEEHQLTRTSMKSSEDFRVPFELLLTRLNLRRVFARVELADAALDHDPADRVLRAFPKKEFAQEYTDVLIELSPQFDMRRLVVNYPDHSRMDFRFDHIERNPPLSRSPFQFTPPAGTEIIDQP